MRSVNGRTRVEASGVVDETAFAITALKTAAAYCMHVKEHGRTLSVSEAEDVQEACELIWEGSRAMVGTRAVEPEERPDFEEFSLRQFIPMRKTLGRPLFWKYYRGLYRVAMKDAHTVADGFAARGDYRNARITCPVVFANLIIIGTAGVLAYIRCPYWSHIRCPHPGIDVALRRIAAMLVIEMPKMAAAG